MDETLQKQSNKMKPIAFIVIAVIVASSFAIFLSQYSFADNMPPLRGKWVASKTYVSNSFSLAPEESEAFSFKYDGKDKVLASGDITLAFESIEEPGFIRVYFYTYSPHGWSWFYLGDGYVDKPTIKLELDCNTCVYIYLEPDNTYAFNVTSLDFRGTVESVTLNL